MVILNIQCLVCILLLISKMAKVETGKCKIRKFKVTSTAQLPKTTGKCRIRRIKVTSTVEPTTPKVEPTITTENPCPSHKQLVIRANPCEQSCANLSKPCITPTKCIKACSCPDNKVEQDGKCVSKAECRCTWNIGILGLKQVSQNPESPPGTKIQKKCNECICKNGRWKCTNNQCTQNCEWNEWENVGVCSVTCGKGIQYMKRTKIEAKYGGKSCEGQDTKTIPCDGSKQCCELNVIFYAAKEKCEQTCDDIVHSRPLHSNCEEGCRCKTGFVRNHKKICVPSSDCYKCLVDGVEWDNGKQESHKKQCKLRTCMQGHIKETILGVETGKPRCNEKDITTWLDARPLLNVSKCCYEPVIKVCQVRKETVTKIKLKTGEICILRKPYERTACIGGCMGNSKFGIIAQLTDYELSNNIIQTLHRSNGSVLPSGFKIITTHKMCRPVQYDNMQTRKVMCQIVGSSEQKMTEVKDMAIIECRCQ